MFNFLVKDVQTIPNNHREFKLLAFSLIFTLKMIQSGKVERNAS